uniref:Uncharacterized protein n=1 Tax=Arundo donax TaxID=35708 RepID=A0A0A9F3Z5_ARUDO
MPQTCWQPTKVETNMYMWLYIMSTSETSSNTSSSVACFDDESSTWWEMGATVGVLTALASSSSSGCGVEDAPKGLQELTGRQWVARNLANSKKCYANFRLHPAAFNLLHRTLVANHGLKSTWQCDSIEALGMFLWACGTRQSQRQVADRFGRSIDTVSRKFGEVLDVVVSFSHTVLRPRDPTFNSVHPKLQKYSPYFDGCIGAIDGTHIPVTVQELAHDDFINRKGFTSQNILAVCDMDMRFIFVATGKRGATHDAAILREAMSSSNNFPHPPQGKYYLVDSGYPLRTGYMAPYRKNRYHLSEFQEKGPEICMRFLTTTIRLSGPLLNAHLGFSRVSGRFSRGYRFIQWRSNQRLLWHVSRCIISQWTTTNTRWMRGTCFSMVGTFIGRVNILTRCKIG